MKNEIKNVVSNEEVERSRAAKNYEPQAPKLEVKYSVSKDGKWLITRTIITDIKSTKYMEKVLEKVEPSKV